uniref:DUF659 domain-containing protein n=1 Tax=Rhizophagus irregularis (strain DAOM 181602 / DAOM 197198 / MUCL 43194) TaxID=747089 RepID=U9TGN1_RHIID
MENFDYYPGEDFDFNPILELQNQTSGSFDIPHETFCLPATRVVVSFERRESFSSHSSLTSLPSQWSNYGPMESFITRSLSSADKIKFHMHLLQVTISCGFSLSWINNPEVIELFKFLNPQIKLPDRKTLSNEILDEAVKEFDIKMLEKLVLDRVGITLSFDGWTNVREQELMGTVLTSSDGQPYVWKASDISSERITNVEIRSKVEEMISELNELKIPLLAIVTDSAPAYNAARKRLQTQYRNIVFLPYIQTEIYGKCIQPVVPGDTRWNSYFNCCKSIIATKNALRSLATKFEPPTSTTRRRPTDPLIIPHEIYNIIMNGIFSESDEDMDDEEFNIEEEFQNQIEQFLEIDSNINDDDFDLDNINVESIEHPAQNKDAKWRLDTMFKDNLHCPF